MQPAADRNMAIFPIEFFTEYKPQPDGSLKSFDMVTCGKRGDVNWRQGYDINRLQKHQPPEWTALKPYYEHWKAGKEAPVNGVPLEAWPGATPQLVKALEPYHIKTVEDLADITEQTMSAIAMPGVRGIKANARAYIDAKTSTAPIAGELSTLREENAKLKDMLADLQEQVAAMKPKRGRPPKVTNEPADNS